MCAQPRESFVCVSALAARHEDPFRTEGDSFHAWVRRERPELLRSPAK
jgi:hypothetical protein